MPYVHLLCEHSWSELILCCGLLFGGSGLHRIFQPLRMDAAKGIAPLPANNFSIGILFSDTLLIQFCFQVDLSRSSGGRRYAWGFICTLTRCPLYNHVSTSCHLHFTICPQLSPVQPFVHSCPLYHRMSTVAPGTIMCPQIVTCTAPAIGIKSGKSAVVFWKKLP